MDDEDIILLQAIAKLIEWQMKTAEILGILSSEKYGDEISWENIKSEREMPRNGKSISTT